MDNFIKYTLIRSNRKTLAIEVNAKLEVIVRSPLFATQRSIDEFVNKHSSWIKKSIEKQENRNKTRLPEPTTEEISAFKRKAKQLLPLKTSYFAGIMDVKVKSVKITSAKKRLGSCSYDGRICYSWRVMMYPERVIDYVIIHELAHIKVHNHSKSFYSLVGSYCPDYREIEKIIKGS
ncbi:MAG: M48 family metallopeptidase [Clostridia bacterium]|nr:M48 family metallopeptidase [Clostridia bacterium]